MTPALRYLLILAEGGGSPTPPPIDRQTYSSEGLAQVTSPDDTTFTTLVSLTFTPDANATYAIFWSGEFGATLGSQAALVVLQGGVESLRAQESMKEISTPTDYKQRGGFLIYEEGASPAALTWEMQIVRVGGSGSARARNGRLVALRLESGDYYGESLGDSTDTVTAYADKATVSFTGSGGGYLILGSGVQEGSSGNVGKCRLSDGTNTSYQVQMNRAGTGQEMPFGIAWNVSGVTGSVTFKTQYGSLTDGTSSTHSNHRILCLDLSGFHGNFDTVLGSNNAGTDTTYTSALTLSETTVDVNYLTFSGWQVDGNITTSSGQSQFVDGGVSIAVNIAEPSTTTSGVGQACFVARVATYASASRTWEIQRLSEAGTLTTTINAGACIATLQLEP